MQSTKKRPRGRPRIHPPRDPNAPRRPRGRPRKNPTQPYPAAAPAGAGDTPAPASPLIRTGDRPGRPSSGRPSSRPPGRPRGSVQTHGRASLPPAITIGEHRVTWAFIKLVYKRLHCDWDNTIDAFWKSRHVTGSNAIQRYIMAGFKPTKYGIPILIPSHERENGQMENIRDWWIQLYRPSRSVRATDPVAPDITSMIDQLTQGMSF